MLPLITTQTELFQRLASKDKRYVRFLPDNVSTQEHSDSYGLVKCKGCRGNVLIKVYEGMQVSTMVRLLKDTTPDDSWPTGWEEWTVAKLAKESLERKRNED